MTTHEAKAIQYWDSMYNHADFGVDCSTMADRERAADLAEAEFRASHPCKNTECEWDECPGCEG